MLGCLAACGRSASGASGVASGANLGVTGAATTRQGAGRVAHGLIGYLALPAGATATGSDPSRDALLAKPGSSAPDSVDLHRFWRVPGEPASTITWFETHPPAGAKLEETGSDVRFLPGGRNEPVRWHVGFLFPATGRRLLVEDAAAAGAGTAVRADAQVPWSARGSAS